MSETIHITLLQKEVEGQNESQHCQPILDDPTSESLPQPAEDLIKEIALLEMEIVYLEKHLLSMYRTNFAKRLSLLPTVDETAKTDLESASVITLGTSAGPLPETGIYLCHSSRSHSGFSFRASPPCGGGAVAENHSLPPSMLDLERMQDSAADANLAEDVDCSIPQRVRETPNWLSEEMIKCISTIYCHLSDPPLISQGFGSFSLPSPPPPPPTRFSPQGQQENSWPNDSVHSEEFSGPFITMVEICSIVRESQRLNAVQGLLLNYKSVISKLAQVDPRKLNHEERLAFWINMHNALVMHAFLVYGTPRGSLKRISLVLKAAYNVGGHTVSVDTIQSSILRCRTPRPTQWLHSLFFPKTKLKAGDPRRAYAVEHQEPRLRFALCSGCRSDPAVRLYTPKKVFQELEMAKEEYIQMNIKLHKEQRLLVPKNVEHFIKEMDLSLLDTVEMLEDSIPEYWRKAFQNPHQVKSGKKVDWVPHNFAFRFLLSNELIRR